MPRVADHSRSGRRIYTGHPGYGMAHTGPAKMSARAPAIIETLAIGTRGLEVGRGKLGKTFCLQPPYRTSSGAVGIGMTLRLVQSPLQLEISW